MKQFNKMFKVGIKTEHEGRISAAITSTNTPPPPYGLKKDHTATPELNYWPPVRLVWGANQAPNSMLSIALSSRIVNYYADTAGIKTGCSSGEKMKESSFWRVQQVWRNVKKQCSVISVDNKALYSNMEWSEIMIAVREMVEYRSQEIYRVFLL